MISHMAEEMEKLENGSDTDHEESQAATSARNNLNSTLKRQSTKRAVTDSYQVGVSAFEQ